MNRKALIGITIGVLLLSLACSFGPGGGGGGEQPSNVIFQDDFSDAKSGWEVGDYETGKVGYGNGVYYVISNGDGDTMWGVANKKFDNVIIDVDATQISAGPDSNNDYGILCREQGDGNGYFFLISGDGFYSILKAEGGEFTPLVDWTDSDVINTGNASNHIQATCNGGSLILTVNGQQLATANDTAYSSGDIALTATSYESQPTEVHFDNLVVSKP